MNILQVFIYIFICIELRKDRFSNSLVFPQINISVTSHGADGHWFILLAHVQLFSNDKQHWNRTASCRPAVALKTGKPATRAAGHPPSCKEKGFYFGKKDLKIILKPGNTP